MSYKRKEIIGDCTLYLGDSLKIIPDLKDYDICVTDPPYGIEDIVGGYGRGGVHKIQNDKNLNVCHEALNTILDRRDNIRIMAFYSCKVTLSFLSGIKGGVIFGDIIWDKLVPGLGANFRYQHENISIINKGQPPPMGKGFSVLKYIRDPDLHPHQKPINLMKEVISIGNGNHILDPFMGSGSTGVACAKMGKKFTGIEIDEKYFDISCFRIEDAYKQPDMFVSQEKFIQETFF